MDPSILELNYNDMLKHAKELGIVFADRKPKKEIIIEKIKEHAELQPTGKNIRKVRKAEKKVDYSEVEEEPKKKKTKKVVKKTAEVAAESAEVEATEPVKKIKKVKKKKTTETEEIAIAEDEEKVEKKVKKVKKEVKSTLKNNETEEMKRIRRSIAEKKQAKLDKSKNTGATSSMEDTEEVVAPKKLSKKTSKVKLQQDESEPVKTKKVKKIKFSDDPNQSGDSSNKMKRRILKKKKKSSSPILKPIAAKTRSRSREVVEPKESQASDLHQSILAETNEKFESEEINDDQFELKLDDEDSNEPELKAVSPEPKQQPRRSVAFTITTTPDVSNIRKSLPTKTPPTRKSIAFTIDTTPKATPKANTFINNNIPSSLNKRKSIAFTIENTPEAKATPVPRILTNQRRSTATANMHTPNPDIRKSITVPDIQVTEQLSVLTNDDDEMNTTYEKPSSASKVPPIVTSPVMSVQSFYKPTVELTSNVTQDLEPVVVQPKPRAKIVRPKQIETSIEPMFKPTKFDTGEVIVKKKVDIVSREAGPRIVKPTAPSPKVSEQTKQRLPFRSASMSSKQRPPVKKPECLKPTTPKIITKKVPDFKAIHARNFNKMEDVKDAQQRLKERHTQLTSGTKPTNAEVSKPTTEENSETVVSSLIALGAVGSSILKKINIFGSSSNDTVTKENSPKPNDRTKAKVPIKDSNISKLKTENREPFKPRTPLGVRTINTLGTPGTKTPKPFDKMNPKTPVSTKKPFTLLNSAKKPAVSKPFHFQNQNLESNINFGGACQFGKNTGTTPLKDSAFQRRKSYNPRESIGRPLSYNPHLGKLKQIENKAKAKIDTNLNESVSVKTASINGATEKRKSIFGMQRNMEKEKLNVKRKVLRNNEMDRPRII